MKKTNCNSVEAAIPRLRCNIRVVVHDQEDYHDINYKEISSQSISFEMDSSSKLPEKCDAKNEVIQLAEGGSTEDAVSLNVINTNRKYKFGSLLDLSQLDRELQLEHNDGKLRRVLTAQVRRRKRNTPLPGFTLTNAVMKEPLRVVHSVPLNFQW
ncbi:hypothetical protein CHUAL_009357 [Chamberlinius hualienensis]